MQSMSDDDVRVAVKVDFISRVFKSQRSVIEIAQWCIDRLQELSTETIEGRPVTREAMNDLLKTATEYREGLKEADRQCRQWIASFAAELDMHLWDTKPGGSGPAA